MEQQLQAGTDSTSDAILSALTEFDELIDAYRDAQVNGAQKDRIDARRALKVAFVKAVRADWQQAA